MTTIVFSLFPIQSPFLSIGIYISTPLVSFAILRYLDVHCGRGTLGLSGSFSQALAKAVHENAAKILVWNCVLTLALSWNQLSIFYKEKIDFATDISYYLRVNSIEYDNANAISLAASDSSFSTVEKSNPTVNFYNAVSNAEDATSSYQRRLTSESWMSFIYHTPTWNNMLTQDVLQDACYTERNIRAHLSCVDNATISSIIPSVFDAATCTPLYPFGSATAAIFDNAINAAYLQDNLNPVYPVSGIVISYMQTTCGQYENSQFSSKLSDMAVGGINIAYINQTLLNKEFLDGIVNAITVTIIAVVLSSCLLSLGLRGVVTAVVTTACVALSLVCAAGVLSAGHYGSFSAFNVMSIFILFGVGGSTVLLFGSSWRSAQARHYRRLQSQIMASQQSTLSKPTAQLQQKYYRVLYETDIYSGLQLDAECVGTVYIDQVLQVDAVHPNEDGETFVRLANGRGWVATFSPDSDCEPILEEIVTPAALDTPVAFRLSDPHILLEAYSGMAGAAFFTAVATFLSLFSKLTSPVIIISQLGLYIGMAYVYFFAQFHFIIIPVWVLTSRYRLPFRFGYYVDVFVGNLWCFRVPTGEIPSRDCDEDFSQTGRDSINRVKVDKVDSFNGDACVDEEEEEPRGSDVEPRSVLNAGNSHESIVLRVKTSLGERGVGLLSLLTALAILAAVSVLAFKATQLDFGIPQLFSASSNLGQIITIVKDYKPTALGGGSAASSYPTGGASSSTPPTAMPLGSISPSRVPTPTPSALTTPTRSVLPTPNPSPAPSAGSPATIIPSAIPTAALAPPASCPSRRPSTAPTPEPTALSPLGGSSTPVSSSTMPTYSPSMAPTLQTPSAPSVSSSPPRTNYMVSGCWGIETYKPYIDSTVQVSWDVATFSSYVRSGAVFSDLKSLCSYVSSQRGYLDINPTWNLTDDCIYQQLQQANASLMAMPAATSLMLINSYWPGTPTTYVPSPGDRYQLLLLYWASLTPAASQLIGVQVANFTTPSGSLQRLTPVWLCANFSAQTDVPSLLSNTALALSIIARWQSAVTTAGGYFATRYSVPQVVGSDDFKFPMLASEVLQSISIAAIISIAGFVFLIFIFTCNASVTLLGVIAMVSILALTLCLHVFFFSRTADLLDVVVLIALIGMIVDFPIHFVLHFYYNSIHCRRSLDSILDEASKHHSLPRMMLSYVSIKNMQLKTNETTLIWTWRYTVWALLPPLVLIGLSAAPLLFASFALLRKTGEYLIILAGVAYAYTLFLLPLLLACTCTFYRVGNGQLWGCNYELPWTRSDDNGSESDFILYGDGLDRPAGIDGTGENGSGVFDRAGELHDIEWQRQSLTSQSEAVGVDAKLNRHTHRRGRRHSSGSASSDISAYSNSMARKTFVRKESRGKINREFDDSQFDDDGDDDNEPSSTSRASMQLHGSSPQRISQNISKDARKSANRDGKIKHNEFNNEISELIEHGERESKVSEEWKSKKTISTAHTPSKPDKPAKPGKPAKSLKPSISDSTTTPDGSGKPSASKRSVSRPSGANAECNDNDSYTYKDTEKEIFADTNPMKTPQSARKSGRIPPRNVQQEPLVDAPAASDAASQHSPTQYKSASATPTTNRLGLSPKFDSVKLAARSGVRTSTPKAKRSQENEKPADDQCEPKRPVETEYTEGIEGADSTRKVQKEKRLAGEGEVELRAPATTNGSSSSGSPRRTDMEAARQSLKLRVDKMAAGEEVRDSSISADGKSTKKSKKSSKKEKNLVEKLEPVLGGQKEQQQQRGEQQEQDEPRDIGQPVPISGSREAMHSARLSLKLKYAHLTPDSIDQPGFDESPLISSLPPSPSPSPSPGPSSASVRLSTRVASQKYRGNFL